MTIEFKNSVFIPVTRPKIKTEFWAKPIPMRQFDWTATEDDYEPGCPIGYGSSENEAVADLLLQLEDRE